MTLFTTLTVGSAIAFLLYGVHCLVSSEMRAEFERFGLPGYRVLTGWLEIAGGAGLLAGFFVPFVQPLAAAGLCLLMLLGVGTRIKVRDGLLQALPAAALMVLNGYIAVAGLRQ